MTERIGGKSSEIVHRVIKQSRLPFFKINAWLRGDNVQIIAKENDPYQFPLSAGYFQETVVDSGRMVISLKSQLQNKGPLRVVFGSQK